MKEGEKKERILKKEERKRKKRINEKRGNRRLLREDTRGREKI